MMETEGPQMTAERGAYALHAGLARLHALLRMHTPTRPGNHMHARTHTYAHKRLISGTYCFSTATVIRELTSLLRYTCIAPLVTNY